MLRNRFFRMISFGRLLNIETVLSRRFVFLLPSYILRKTENSSKTLILKIAPSTGPKMSRVVQVNRLISQGEYSIVYSLITYRYKPIYYTVFVHYLKRFLSASHAVVLYFYYIFLLQTGIVLSSSITSFPCFTTTIFLLVSLLFYAT